VNSDDAGIVPGEAKEDKGQIRCLNRLYFSLFLFTFILIILECRITIKENNTYMVLA
jgi:hypothetical protein